MKAKRWLTLAVVAIVLCGLAYLQFRSWRNFNWAAFRAYFASASKLHLLLGLAVIYFDYYLRAWRWKVLTRPAKRVSALALLPSQVIGFTAIALLGRPGDLVRPYLVAKREGLPLSAQMAVLAVERVFDIGCFAILLVVTLLFSTSLQSLPQYGMFRWASLLLLGGVVVAALLLVMLWRSGDAIASWIEKRIAKRWPHVSESICHKITQFSNGLHTIHDTASLLQVFGVSMLIWLLIAVAYTQVTHAYANPVLRGMAIPQVVLLMCASIAGSLLQLPMVGGGSQLGTIAVLERVFRIENHELAASCGIMLWLITFMSIVPVGLIWARFEHLNLREVSAESEAAEATEV